MDLEQVKEIKARYRDQLLALPNVVGVGVGSLAGGYIIRVYVREYRRWDGPYQLDGVPVMTELVGDVVAGADRPVGGRGAGRMGE